MENIEDISIVDESGDREYFTIIPNYIINHSTANDQALYMQMKRFAGEKGQCYASKRTLMKQLGIGRKSLDKSIKYLIEHGWIKDAGTVVRDTVNGPQKVTVFTMVNIWKLNSQHYKGGAAERTYPPEGCVQKNIRGASQRAPKKIHVKEEPIPLLRNGANRSDGESVETEKPQRGREDINWLVAEFERIRGFKASSSKDRRFAAHLLRNFSQDQLTAMLTFCEQDEFAPRVGSLEKLWYKRGDVIAGIKAMKTKSDKNSIRVL